MVKFEQRRREKNY